MTDHRRIQRSLFRMQHDEGFARALRERDPQAVASTGLSADDLDLLLETGAAAVEADAGGRRRAQFLRNVAGEHALTVALAQLGGGADPALLESFTGSAFFHRAIREDLRLPLAFGEHAEARAGRTGDALLLALARLETAMAWARRHDFPRGLPEPGGLVLSARAEVLVLPAGTVHAAGEIRSALDAGRHEALSARAIRIDEESIEHALVLGRPRESPHRLAEVALEVLSPLAGELLWRSRTPLSVRDMASFRAEHDVTEAELAGFLEDLVAEGIVLRG